MNHLILPDKTSQLVAIKGMPEVYALCERDMVLVYCNGGEESLFGKLRSAPASQKRLLKAIIKMFAPDKHGNDFAYQPDRVDEDGFRPYFVEDLMEWSGINSRRTVSDALKGLEDARIITRRKGTKDKLTGKFTWAMIRFNPLVLRELYLTVKRLLTESKNRLKSAFRKLAPSAMHCRPSSSFSPGDGIIPPPKESSLVSDETQPVIQDRKLEEVIGILTATYPDVENLDYQNRGKVKNLVHNFFPWYRLTPEMARSLVACKQWDDENVNSDVANTQGRLEGFNRFEKFIDLLPYWKSHIAKILRSELERSYDDRVLSAAGYKTVVEEVISDPTQPVANDELTSFRDVVSALAAGGVAKVAAMKARGYLLNNETAYATLVRKFPALQQWCEIKRHDHDRLLRAFRNQETKINVWMAIRKYVTQ